MNTHWTSAFKLPSRQHAACAYNSYSYLNLKQKTDLISYTSLLV